MPINSPPEPPDYLDDYALIEWGRITAELIESKRFNPKDLHLLAAYCREVSEYKLAYDEIQDDIKRAKDQGAVFDPSSGRTIVVADKDGNVKALATHPAFDRANKALKNFQSLAQQFGFTPASRKSIYGSA